MPKKSASKPPQLSAVRGTGRGTGRDTGRGTGRGNATFGDAATAHQPFAEALAGLKTTLVQQAETERRRVKEEAKRPPPPSPPPPPGPPLSDAELLALAMSGTQPVRGPDRVGLVTPVQLERRVHPGRTTAEPMEAAPTAVPETDEPDWWQGEVDPALLWALGGDRPWQKRVVLLGGDVVSLQRSTHKAVAMAREQHLGCLLLVFGGVARPGWGQGGRSPGWLVRKYLREELRDRIIGYMTANPADGGANSLYCWVRPDL